MTLYRSLSVDLPVEMCSRTAATAVSRSNNNNNNNLFFSSGLVHDDIHELLGPMNPGQCELKDQATGSRLADTVATL